MEEDFLALLRGDAQLLALVPAANMSLGDLSQGTVYPGVVCNVVQAAEGITHAGPDGLQQGRVQVDCNALNYGQAKAISRRVVAILHGYRGGRFRGVFHELTRDDREGGTNQAVRPYRVTLDFATHWRTTT